MNKLMAKKGYDLSEEIDDLMKYKKMLSARHGDCVHFEIVQHYGDTIDRIKIERKHNTRLFREIDKIITELEKELESL